MTVRKFEQQVGTAFAKHASVSELTQEMREDFRGILIQGRWLLVAAQSVSSLALIAEGHYHGTTLLVFSLLAFYNLLSLVAVYRVPLRPRLLLAALSGDIVLTGLAAWQTGTIHSPFLGQYYLIIFAGALLYDLRGGVFTGLGAAIIAAVLASTSPERVQAFRSLANLAPYYLIAGGFAGLLVQRVRGFLKKEYDLRLRDEAARREIELARVMQEAALPEIPPSLPGLECAVFSRYAAEVGGDFLLFLTPEKTKRNAGIVIGDVAGKGIPAALASTSIAHLLPWLKPLKEPLTALRNLNADLLERLPESSYATLILAVTEPDTSTLCLWTAGHPPAVHYHASERKATLIETSELPIGMFPDWKEVPVTLRWEPGDALLLYTDGLTEARNREDGKQFTAERVADILTAQGGQSATEILDAVRMALESWGTPTDDVTVVAIKCRSKGEA